MPFNPVFGRREPKDWAHVLKYPFKRRGLGTVRTVNFLPPRLSPETMKFYTQTGNSCTGFGNSISMSVYNSPMLFDGMWLYHRGQETDNDPETRPDNDVGGYVDAALNVLRKEGHCEVVNGVTRPVNPQNGIISYDWGSIDDARTAAAVYQRHGVLGIRWYRRFSYGIVKKKNKEGKVESWIGTEWTNNGPDFGSLDGEHCIAYDGITDEYMRLPNSWGPEYGDDGYVLMPLETVDWLLQQGGELAIIMDIPNSPVPPAPPVDVATVELKVFDKQFSHSWDLAEKAKAIRY